MCWFWAKKRRKRGFGGSFNCIYKRGLSGFYTSIHALGHQSMARPSPARRSRGYPPADLNRVNHPRNRDLEVKMEVKLVKLNTYIYIRVYGLAMPFKAYKRSWGGFRSPNPWFIDFFMILTIKWVILLKLPMGWSDHGRLLPPGGHLTVLAVFRCPRTGICLQKVDFSIFSSFSTIPRGYPGKPKIWTAKTRGKLPEVYGFWGQKWPPKGFEGTFRHFAYLL